MKKCHIVKNPRVLQTLFYMLGYTREQICERGTNALDFKLAKELIDETLFTKMGQYAPAGQREGEFKPYQKISFLRNNIADLDEEKVESHCLVMGKVLRWIQMALEIRCDDVVNRRDTVEYIKQDREQSMRAEAERLKKFDTELAEKKQIFEEAQAEAAKEAEEAEGDDKKEPVQFDEGEFKVEFELANMPISV